MESDTRGNLVGAAQELMMRQGYAATGINDICRRAGVSKGAFYHAFASKEELTLTALEAFYRDGIQGLAGLAAVDAPAEDHFLVFLDAVGGQAAMFWQSGCLLGGLATEMAESNEVLQARISEMFQKMSDLLAQLAEPFVASLALDGLTASDLGDQFLAVVEGAIVLSRAHGKPEMITHAIARYALFLRHLPRR